MASQITTARNKRNVESAMYIQYPGGGVEPQEALVPVPSNPAENQGNHDSA
jgi:hypothetical protein